VSVEGGATTSLCAPPGHTNSVMKFFNEPYFCPHETLRFPGQLYPESHASFPPLTAYALLLGSCFFRRLCHSLAPLWRSLGELFLGSACRDNGPSPPPTLPTPSPGFLAFFPALFLIATNDYAYVFVLGSPCRETFPIHGGWVPPFYTS